MLLVFLVVISSYDKHKNKLPAYAFENKVLRGAFSRLGGNMLKFLKADFKRYESLTNVRSREMS